jgi:RNA polymerase sigma-70 factor (ECF subfamily)
MNRPDDKLGQWLASARGGSSEALGQALENYRHYLLLVAEKELDSALQAKAGASDLVQETFLEAQRDWVTFHGNSEDELRAWLRRLLLNNVANFTRSFRATNKRQVGLEVPLQPSSWSGTPGGGLPADISTPSQVAQEHERAEALNRALERLPESYRQVLLWRYQEQRSFEEISQALQCSANAARKLWARALERLEKEMEASQ